MATNRKESEVAFLAYCEHMVNNADSHPLIIAGLEEVFFTAEMRVEGKNMHKTAFDAFQKNRKEHNEESQSYDAFEAIFVDLEAMYMVDKKKALVSFKRDAVAKQDLGLDVKYPRAYENQYLKIFSFYTMLNDNSGYCDKMARFKFDEDSVQRALNLLSEVKDVRETYLKEKGEAQTATIVKDEALAALDIWIDDFEDIAEIAFMEQPQLLEILGIVVKR